MTQEVLARAAGGQQHAEVAEIVRGLGDLPEVRERDLAPALARAQIAAVAVRRQEPENVGAAVGAC